ncbi:MAG: type II toxin-antitoxin system VapC family toxin [Actinomycetota bacterium]
MIVLDASAALNALLTDGKARHLAATEQLHSPYLIDSEVVSVLRRKVLHHQITAQQGDLIVQTWQAMGLTRHSTQLLLQRIWSLRDNLSAYDASYVALAEALDCTLVTSDARLSRAPGMRCSLTVIPL